MQDFKAFIVPVPTAQIRSFEVYTTWPAADRASDCARLVSPLLKNLLSSPISCRVRILPYLQFPQVLLGFPILSVSQHKTARIGRTSGVRVPKRDSRAQCDLNLSLAQFHDGVSYDVTLFSPDRSAVLD